MDMETTLSRERTDEWLGVPLYSWDGEEIGSVAEVFLDTETSKPEWLAVTAGVLRSKRRLVPVVGAERRPNGIHLPYSAAQIYGTPEVEGSEVGQETERVLYSCYGLEYSERRSTSGLPERRGTSSQSNSAATKRQSKRAQIEPTRDELYAEAKRLQIRGRSKMNKQDLARAVGRARERSGGHEKANPIEVQTFLEGVGYPMRKADLVREAERQGASAHVRSTLRRIRDEKFDSPADVSEAIGRLT
jgi:sporulation protein YlmC with PRC-barrel domain